MKTKDYKGITLIALIITIIVLLILAGVSVSILTGENGILNRTGEGVEETDVQQIKEQIKLELLSIVAEGDGTYTVANVNEAAKTVTGNEPVEDEETGVVTVTTARGNVIDITDIISEASDAGASYWYYDEDGNITNGKKTLAIGDYVDYDEQTGATTTSYTSTSDVNGYGDQVFDLANYTSGWRVLGVDEDTGELLLVSESNVTGTTYTSYYLSGQAGYANSIEELDAISSLYGQGYGASGARSITVDDVNKITGYNPNNVGVYDPEQTGSGTKYGEGSLSEYGNKVTYSWQGTAYPYYSGTNGITGSLRSSSHSTFYWYDNGWKNSKKSSTASSGAMEEITTLTSDFYSYYPSTLTTSSSGDTVGISTSSTEYNMLFKSSYWLGSRYFDGYGDFRVRMVLDSYGDLWVCPVNLCSTSGVSVTLKNGVRPVVALCSCVDLIRDGMDDVWSIK